MFQSFDATSAPALALPRVARLRDLMTRSGIDLLLVPRADEHQGEYVPANAERLAYITGFTGSAGMALIARTFAALATDGRYLLQGRAQLDAATFEIVDGVATPWFEWVKSRLDPGAVIGFDPKLHTAQAIETLAADAKKAGFKLKPLARNLVDTVWGRERPPHPKGAVTIQPAELTGATAAEKIARVQAVLKDEKQTAVVLTLPDSIAWLLNIRGGDVAHNPVALAFAIVPVRGKVDVFVDATKIDAKVKAHLGASVKLLAPDALGDRLVALKAEKSAVVRADFATASHWIVTKLGRAAVNGVDPCIAFKARKSAAELDGTRAAHVRDGAAMCRFLAWFDRESGSGRLDEITCVKKLEEIRRATNALKDISFDTISGSGPNGAIVHYRVTTPTNRTLKSGELFLIDSGGQYQDGTTDITRTLAVGAPSREMVERYTLVLKGHIALATARFPIGTRGVQLDTLARMHLWNAGLDYDHGTGHGVGSYLSVHEGPQSISKRGMAALEPGMIVSNEPGYYKTGAYGIRIENLIVVTPPQKTGSGDRDMLGFETITLAPYDRRLIEPRLLDAKERQWIDTYHARVLKQIGPQLAGGDKAWLVAATKPLDG
ncbi:MAG TPA: aminopeptidase P family protein [Hyphomicrobiaceae bacterium]|nr:aminopeptidase P family protein [Hyphomicrobiaceae bacterium]